MEMVMTPDEQLLQEINAWLPKIPGWCTPAKAAALVKVIRETKPALSVELGIFGGSSLIPQALALKLNGTGVIHGIDPWERGAVLEDMAEEANKQWWGKVDLEDIYKHAAHFVQHLEVSSIVTLIRARAESVAHRYAEASIDLLHIDGNHAEEPAYRDAVLWFPKVKTDGYIFFDDIDWQEGTKQTTRKALMYLLERCRRIDVVGDCMILQRIS